MYLLSARHISKHYIVDHRKAYALRPCSIAFPEKGFIAIEGKSGSGKSTLLNVLSGIETSSSGAVFYQGKRTSKDKEPLVAKHAGMIFQHYNLIDGISVLDNVALPGNMRGAKRKKAKELLQRFHLSHLASRDVKNLSGGEKQRVAICRALINDPPILFADEPTGALDEANSITVMECLKEIAKERLVIMVSHNHALVQRYAEAILWIADGAISGRLPHAPLRQARKEKHRHSSSWLGNFVFRNIKRNAFKDAMCFLSGVVGFLSLLMSFGYIQGNMPAMEKEQEHTLSFLSAEISKRTVIELPGSTLSLVKKTLPSFKEVRDVLEDIGDYELCDNYSYFFPSAMPFEVEGEMKEPCSFLPLWDITLKQHGLDRLIWGEAPEGLAFNECVINQEFLDKYGDGIKGQEIFVSQRSVATYKGKQNEVFVEARLEVKGVVKEFGFLNVPKVYYSYPKLQEALSQIDFVDELGDSIDIVSFVEACEPDSVYGSYSRLLFFASAEEVTRLFAKLDAGIDEGYEIASSPYTLRNSFSSLSSAFVSSLCLFVGLAFVGLALILGMASFSSFVSGRKESALLTVLGAKRVEINAIFVFESMLVCAGSAALSLLFAPLLQSFLNGLLAKKFDVNGLIAIPFQRFMGVPLLVPLALLLGASLLAFLSSSIPLFIHRRLPLVEELRDE